MTTSELERLSGRELRPIVHWRFDSLVRAGYAERQALVIALDVDADLHLAVELIERGCPPHTAMRIVL